jgi:hypothetical protein
MEVSGMRDSDSEVIKVGSIGLEKFFGTTNLYDNPSLPLCIITSFEDHITAFKFQRLRNGM